MNLGTRVMVREGDQILPGEVVGFYNDDLLIRFDEDRDNEGRGAQFPVPYTFVSYAPKEAVLVRRQAFNAENMLRWIEQIYGNGARADVDERCARFLEEAVETVQAHGMGREQAHALVDYVFDRPASLNVAQELGGTLTTLLALALVRDVDLASAANAEFHRMVDNAEKIKAKQRAKPKEVSPYRRRTEEKE